MLMLKVLKLKIKGIMKQKMPKATNLKSLLVVTIILPFLTLHKNFKLFEAP